MFTQYCNTSKILFSPVLFCCFLAELPWYLPCVFIISLFILSASFFEMALCSLLPIIKERKYVYRNTILCIWLLNHSTSFNEIWYKDYVIGKQLYTRISQFLTNCNIAWQTRELTRWVRTIAGNGPSKIIGTSRVVFYNVEKGAVWRRGKFSNVTQVASDN